MTNKGFAPVYLLVAVLALISAGAVAVYFKSLPTPNPEPYIVESIEEDIVITEATPSAEVVTATPAAKKMVPPPAPITQPAPVATPAPTPKITIVLKAREGKNCTPESLYCWNSASDSNDISLPEKIRFKVRNTDTNQTYEQSNASQFIVTDLPKGHYEADVFSESPYIRLENACHECHDEKEHIQGDRMCGYSLNMNTGETSTIVCLLRKERN